jgi:hypothetical protein
MLSREAEKPLDRMAQDYEDYLKRDNCLGCGGEDKKPESCAITRPRIVGLAPGFNAAYRNNWTGVRKWLADLYGFSQPWLAQIQDPATRGNEERALRSSVLASQGAFGQTLLNWQGEATIAYQPWDKDCGTVPPIAVKPGKLKPYKIDPTACQSGETHMNFGLANFNADCEKMVLDFGEGVVGSGEYKFGDDWGSDQVTIFAGAGVSGGLGPLSAGAKTGSYITFQGGEVVDYGNKSSAGINVGFGPMSAGAEGSVRISGVSGLDTNLDSGVTIGAPAPED